MPLISAETASLFAKLVISMYSFEREDVTLFDNCIKKAPGSIFTSVLDLAVMLLKEL